MVIVQISYTLAALKKKTVKKIMHNIGNPFQKFLFREKLEK